MSNRLTEGDIAKIQARLRDYARRWPVSEGIYMHDFVTPDDVSALIEECQQARAEADKWCDRLMRHRSQGLTSAEWIDIFEDLDERERRKVGSNNTDKLTALQRTILERLANGYTLQWTNEGWTVYSPINAPGIEENRLAVNDLLARGYLKAAGATSETIGITSNGIEALAALRSSDGES